MNRRGRAGEIVDLVDLDIERKGHVVTDELETLLTNKVFDVAPRAGEEIIHTEHFVTAGEQIFAKKRADKARAPGDQHTSTKMH